LVQYEDRSKLLNNSQKTLPDFQVVTETEAESLVVQDSERILRENGIPRLCFNPGSKKVHRKSRRGTDSLVPQDPLILGGGTISTGPSNFFVRNSSLTSSKEFSFPIQESRKTAAAAATATTQQKMGNEVGTKVPPLDEIKDNEDVFLVLPSYAEPFSQKIRQIIFAEKQKLCKHKRYGAIFSKIKIRLAYTNHKNINKLVVRTKI
jgi:hypothetical protein